MQKQRHLHARFIIDCLSKYCWFLHFSAQKRFLVVFSFTSLYLFFFWQLTIYWKALVGLPLVFCLGAFVFHNHISLTSHSHLNIFVMHKFVRNCCLIFSSNPHCTPKPHSLPAMRPRWRVTYLWLIYVETFLAVSEPHNHNTDVEYIIWLELKRYKKKWI